MSLESFLIALLEDKQIDSFDVEIIEDNALNTSQSKLSLEPEEPRCKWSQLKRLDSDSQLIRPRLRASKGLGRHAMNDKSQSDPSLLRMPQRLASPNNNMRKPLTLPRQAGEQNAIWGINDLQGQQKLRSNQLLNIILATDIKSSTPFSSKSKSKPSDLMMFGLQHVSKSTSRSHQSFS